MKGSKRLVVLLDAAERERIPLADVTALGEFASILWRGPAAEKLA